MGKRGGFPAGGHQTWGGSNSGGVPRGRWPAGSPRPVSGDAVSISISIINFAVALEHLEPRHHCSSQATEVDLMTGCRRLAEEVKRGLEQLSLYHALSR